MIFIHESVGYHSGYPLEVMQPDALHQFPVSFKDASIVWVWNPMFHTRTSPSMPPVTCLGQALENSVSLKPRGFFQAVFQKHGGFFPRYKNHF